MPTLPVIDNSDSDQINIDDDLKEKESSINSDSDKDLERSDESESEEEGEVKFIPKKYGKIYPEEEKYYVVNYDKKAYIGRVLKVSKVMVKIKFLERRMNNQYDWPKRDDIDEVEMIHLIAGPILLTGTTPFTIRGIDRTLANFKTHVRASLM